MRIQHQPDADLDPKRTSTQPSVIANPASTHRRLEADVNWSLRAEIGSLGGRVVTCSRHALLTTDVARSLSVLPVLVLIAFLCLYPTVSCHVCRCTSCWSCTSWGALSIWPYIWSMQNEGDHVINHDVTIIRHTPKTYVPVEVSGKSCPPAPSLVLWRPLFPHVFFSGGVFISHSGRSNMAMMPRWVCRRSSLRTLRRTTLLECKHQWQWWHLCVLMFVCYDDIHAIHACLHILFKAT